ncbi:MAG: Crp/Fnr family transcriptional regulator [Myxococcota bacterium]
MEWSDDAQAELLARHGKRIAAGETLYSEGDRADFVYLVHTGRLRVVRRFHAKRRSMTVRSPGDLLGEEALLGDGLARPASAVALTDAEVIALRRDEFGAFLSGTETAPMYFLTQLAQRLRDADEQLENHHLRDHGSRIINTLLRLDEGGDAGRIRISPLELSSRVGLDVDSVKRAVQRLRDGGYLRIRDERIVITDRDALRQLQGLLAEKELLRESQGAP